MVLSIDEKDELIVLVVDKLVAALKVDINNDMQARQTIHSEVIAVIRSGKDVQPADIAKLENRIKAKLAGTTDSSTRFLDKVEKEKQDEWAMLASLAAAQEKEQKAAQAQELKQKKQAAQQQIKAQEEESKRKAKVAKEAKKAEMEENTATVNEWRKNEVAKRDEKRNQMKALKSDREAQLSEQLLRRELAASIRKIVDADAFARTAEELKRASKAEAESKLETKSQLKAFLASNEALRAEKEVKKAAQTAADIKLMQEYAASLERQERMRADQLAKLQAVQAQQAEDAATRPEFKRWMPEEIIEKQLKSHEAKAAEDDKNRAEALAASNEAFKSAISNQVAEKRAKETVQKQLKKDQRCEVEAAVSQAALEEKKRKTRETTAKQKARAELDAQIKKDRAAAKSRRAMNSTEQKLNAKLLREAQERGLANKAAKV